ncbi:uncharacterized protein LOC143672737 [Tamandua tetradactyla]|uniref:uncharacterized protein LOC143672737 n=1 Tax=Tamandua tetradactyla TaxID=48850 RepID=UPI0040546ECE
MVAFCSLPETQDLPTLRAKLQGLLWFLRDALPISNEHTVDFYTGSLWEQLVDLSPAIVLSVLKRSAMEADTGAHPLVEIEGRSCELRGGQGSGQGPAPRSASASGRSRGLQILLIFPKYFVRLLRSCDQHVGKMYSKSSSFLNYVRKPPKKLELDESKMPEKIIMDYSEKYKPRMNELEDFNMLKVV